MAILYVFRFKYLCRNGLEGIKYKVCFPPFDLYFLGPVNALVGIIIYVSLAISAYQIYRFVKNILSKSYSYNMASLMAFVIHLIITLSIVGHYVVLYVSVY